VGRGLALSGAVALDMAPQPAFDGVDSYLAERLNPQQGWYTNRAAEGAGERKPSEMCRRCLNCAWCSHGRDQPGDAAAWVAAATTISAAVGRGTISVPIPAGVLTRWAQLDRLPSRWPATGLGHAAADVPTWIPTTDLGAEGGEDSQVDQS
jgi:hypothetical protein